MNTHPPRLATALLKRFCRLEFLEEIEGDLEEHFQARLSRRGKLFAVMGYWRDVFYAIMTTAKSRNGNDSQYSASFSDLFKHFVKVSIRQLQRSRSTTLINISGLSVSIACFLFILIYLINETSYDSMHPDVDNVFRISRTFHAFGDGEEVTDARVPGLWTTTLSESMPEILAYTRFSRFGYPGMVRYEKRDMINVEQQFFWVDSTYTNIFSLPMIKGENPAAILRDPTKVIINETIAEKYFGSDDPVGETMIYQRDGLDIPLVVGGVMKNYPANTHFHPQFIANNLALEPLWARDGEINSSYTGGGVNRINSWTDAFTYSYVKLQPGTLPGKMDRVIRDLLKTHLKEDAKYVWPTITPLADIHYQPNYQIELEPPGDKVYLYLFGCIGILILLVACINYMNIATAKSLQRSKEVGLRKALGIKRWGLILQFVGESTVITGISTAFALVFIVLFLPGYNDLSGQWLSLSEILTSKILILLFVLILMIGLLAGSYPAFYLSAFKPLDVLRGKLRSDGGAERLRKSLVVFQFTITLLLVVGTLVVRNQLSFINQTKLSEFKDQVVTVRLFGIAHPRYIESFSNEIRRQSFVENMSMGSELPRQESYGWIDVRLKALELNKSFETWKHLDMDVNFPTLFNLEFIAGRNFSPRNSNDTSKLIINEAAVKNLGVTPERAVGVILEDEFTHARNEVIGVVRDFSYGSIRHQVEPLVIYSKGENAEVMYIKLKGGNPQAAIEYLEKTWKRIVPGSPFEFWFMDKQFDRLYRQEKSTGVLFSYFSILTIIIGCLGLLGLASYTVEQKSKEIGVRKVLGATGVQILMMMTSRFVRLTLIAVIVGTPLAYFLVNSWLNRFAYKAEIHWSVFVLSGIFLLVITCLTVAFESTRAALQNPVKSLRHE